MKLKWVADLWMGAVLWGCACLFMPSLAIGEVLPFELSARMGVDAYAEVEYFHLYEIDGIVGFSPYLKWGDGWSVSPALIGSLGMLHAAEKDGIIAGIGPRLELLSPWSGLMAFASFRPSAMSRHQYGRENLGGWFAFATDVGVRIDIGASAAIGYVWGHISNANIYHDNPGVNFHILEMTLKF